MKEQMRRWFQIRLATLLVMSVIAGGLLWLNVRRNHSYLQDEYGWPIVFAYQILGYDAFMPGPDLSLRISPILFVANFVANILILIAVAATTERFWRWRDSLQQHPSP